MAITDSNHIDETPSTDRFDPFVKGAAIGATVVLVGFLLIAGALYFSSDYDFATAVDSGEPADAALAPTPGDPSDAQQVQLDGMAIAQGIGCFDCHTVTGADLVGPTWQGLIGRNRVFEDGSSVVADPTYVRESIMDPKLHIVEGFPPVMTTSYAERLSDSEIDAIVAYIGTLSG